MNRNNDVAVVWTINSPVDNDHVIKSVCTPLPSRRYLHRRKYATSFLCISELENVPKLETFPNSANAPPYLGNYSASFRMHRLCR